MHYALLVASRTLLESFSADQKAAMKEGDNRFSNIMELYADPSRMKADLWRIIEDMEDADAQVIDVGKLFYIFASLKEAEKRTTWQSVLLA